MPSSERVGVVCATLDGGIGSIGEVIDPRISYWAPHEVVVVNSFVALGSWDITTRVIGESLTKPSAVPGLEVTIM